MHRLYDDFKAKRLTWVDVVWLLAMIGMGGYVVRCVMDLALLAVPVHS